MNSTKKNEWERYCNCYLMCVPHKYIWLNLTHTNRDLRQYKMLQSPLIFKCYFYFIYIVSISKCAYTQYLSL